MPATPESQSGDGISPYNQSTTPAGTSAAHTPPNPDSSIVKVTRGHSCVLCQQRKVRCDKKKPCSNCVKAGVDCRVVPPQPPRRRKKRIPERDLVERLRKYEALLSQNGVEFDALGPDVKITNPGSVEEGDELDPAFMRQRSKDSPAGEDPDTISSPGENLHRPRAPVVLTSLWLTQIQFRPQDEQLRDSSEEEDVGSSINHAYDKMFDNSNGFPFVVGGQYESVTDLHPSAIQIFQLWQIYLNNVNPLLKLTHTPTLQVRIIEAGANLDKVSRSLEALMFAIYLMAVTSISPEETEETFNESRSALLAKYNHGTQQALLNAGFMRMPDLTLLQAYLLYCLGVRQYTDPRSLFCLTGMGVRLAHRLGLQRDGAEFGFTPFEIEQRRRLWWTLAGFDRRIGEMCGSTITAISTGGNCKLPLNINDADLHLNAKDSPTPQIRATEMIFALTRLEFSKAPGNDKMRAQLSAANPQAVTNLADHRLPGYIDQFSHYMEETYLKYCDPKIPIHYITLLMTRANICKLKIMSGFFRVALTAPSPLPPAESEALFIEAIKMVEYDSMIQAHESLKGYLWYTMMHFPLPAYVCLLTDLRQRTTGDLCERAWETIFEHADRRKMTTHTQSPLHQAFAPLFVRAWDAREEAEAAHGRTLAPPRLITLMRQIEARMPKKPKQKTPLPTPSPKIPVASTSYVSPPGDVADANVQSTAPMYPHTGMFAGSMPTDMNRQFATAFPDIQFGGEMDWSFLIQEYGGGYIPPPVSSGPLSGFEGSMPILQDPTQAGTWQ
ncbi:fungal-specific transcription factor domain-containing protein [Xylariomycetidae sp. FL0641]|nr:fungal-specific transcription factor domain-containing protein [Xylariomycetidae sp. FL0641]